MKLKITSFGDTAEGIELKGDPRRPLYTKTLCSDEKGCSLTDSTMMVDKK